MLFDPWLVVDSGHMRLLQQLITTLSEDERRHLETMPLRGKKQQVLLALLNHYNEPEKLDEEIATLDISKTHLYEMSSLLLDASYELLAPQGGIELLEFLVNKNLPVHFKKEFRSVEKEYKKASAAERGKFYLMIYLLVGRFPYTNIDHELLEYSSKQFLSTLSPPDPDYELAFVADKIKQEMVHDQLVHRTKEKIDQASKLEKLMEYVPRATASNNIFLKNIVFRSLAWYWRFVEKDSEKVLHYLQQIEPFIPTFDTTIYRNEPYRSYFELADVYFDLGRHEESLNIFREAYGKTQSSDDVWKQYRFLFRYVELLIYLGQYEEAEQLLHKQFGPLLPLEPTSVSATAATLFAIYYIFTDNYPKAKEYLDIGMALNTKDNYTLYNEVRNRYVEAVYYYLIYDWYYTITVCERALQYLRSKGMALSEHSFGYFFKIIEASIEFYEHGTPFSEELEAKYDDLSSPKEVLFGLLLQKVRNTNPATNRTNS